MAYCAGLPLDGAGWRLPTLTELKSIVEQVAGYTKTINQTAFPETTAGWFWTSSPDPDAGSVGMYYIDFNRGSPGIDNKFDCNFVRCVR
jgi:hypothetical protein